MGRPAKTVLAVSLPPAKVPAPPSWVKGREREMWKRYAAQVEALQTFTVGHLGRFEALVKAATQVSFMGERVGPEAAGRLLQALSALQASFGIGQPVTPQAAKLRALPTPGTAAAKWGPR